MELSSYSAGKLVVLACGVPIVAIALVVVRKWLSPSNAIHRHIEKHGVYAVATAAFFVVVACAGTITTLFL